MKSDIQIIFIEAYNFFWKTLRKCYLEEIHSTDIHITQHTSLTYTITRSPTPSLASEDVIHKFTLTGQITRKITHTPYSIQISFIEARQKKNTHHNIPLAI